MGKRVLVVDADPQGSVGYSLTRKTRTLKGFFDYLTADVPSFESVLVPTKMPTLTLVPAGQSSAYDVDPGLHASASDLVKEFLTEAEKEDYDICIVDTAAGLFGVTKDVLLVSDAVMIPQQAEPLGIRSMPKMLAALKEVRDMNPRLYILGVLLTMVQGQLPESVDAANALRDILPENLVMRSEIPRDDLFIKASARGLPVGIMEGAEEVLGEFNALRTEIEEKLNILRPSRQEG